MNGPSTSSNQGSRVEPRQAASAQPSPQQEPPRKQAEVRTLRDRFSEKLSRDENSGTRGRDAHGLASNKQERSGALPLKERQHDHQDSGLLGRNDTAQLATRSVSSSAANAAALVPLDPQVLSRMAAQISESWPAAKASEAMVQFGDGAIAETAQIKRDADGSIAIRIAGMNPHLTAQQTARAHIELLNAFARRRLPVVSLQFEKVQKDYRGRASAIPRAV